MKKLSVLLGLAAGLAHAQTIPSTQTREARLLGAASVDSLYKIEHVLEWQRSDPDATPEALTETLRLAVIQASGSGLNPLSTMVLSRPSYEGSVEQAPVFTFQVGPLNEVRSVTKRTDASGSSYILIAGSSLDVETLRSKNRLFSVKYTDNENNYLANLEVKEVAVASTQGRTPAPQKK